MVTQNLYDGGAWVCVVLAQVPSVMNLDFIPVPNPKSWEYALPFAIPNTKCPKVIPAHSWLPGQLQTRHSPGGVWKDHRENGCLRLGHYIGES